jgi:dienelactone hydrolase
VSDDVPLQPTPVVADLHRQTSRAAEDCRFSSHGVNCRGWLYAPAGPPPHACVVLAHGFGADQHGPLGVVGRRFAAAGIAAFAFDYRHFGRSDGEPRQLLAVENYLADWAAAVAYVRTRPDIDAARVGLWGSSLSGGLVLSIAGRDPDIAAAVSQVPFCDGRSLALAAGVRHHLKTLPAVLRDYVNAALGRRPHLIDALGPPDTPAAVDTRFPATYDRVLERAPAWRNRIAARGLIDMYRFRPALEASTITCPLLVVLSYVDHVAPPAPGIRVAHQLPYAELAMFQAQHFDLYAGDASERALRTEVQFMVHHLLPSRRPAAV